jgi:tetratricopeptide (TPR) repeat protein
MTEASTETGTEISTTSAHITALLDQAWAKRIEQLEASLQDFQTAKQQAQAIGDLLLYAQALVGIGAIASTQGQYQAAFDCYNEALELFKAANDYDWQAATLNRIGIAFGSSGDLESALSYYSQAAEMATNKVHRLEYQSNFAIIQGNLGNWSEALALQREILAAGYSIFTAIERMEIEGKMANALLQIFIDLRRKGLEKEAQLHWQECLEICQHLLQEMPKHGHYRLRSESYRLLAEIEQLRGRN